MKLSVITVNLNNRNGLQNTIESVLCQQIDQPIEFIVVDGLSTDGSVELLQSYGDKISRTLIEKDNGIYNAMNKGIRKASGDYLLFLNSADTLRSNSTLENIIPKLDGSDLVVGLTSYRSDNGIERITQLPVTACDLNFLIKASLPHQSTFIRKKLLVQVGYDEELKICSDWKFFLEVVCMKKCSVKIINDIVTNFDMTGISTNPQNYSSIDSEKKRVLWETLKFDWDDWKRLESRVLTADYYEKLWHMKFYFFVNNIFRLIGFRK